MISKAVIPAAGFGTRFLPATKAQPKEMLPIVDTPTIQYVVQEAVDAGITDILLITGRGKQAIEDHFDRTYELEADLQKRGKSAQLAQVRQLAEMARIHYIRQREMRGLGDAIRHAREHVGEAPFLVLLGDTIVDAPLPCARQIIDVYHRFNCPVVAVETVDASVVDRYGIIEGEAQEEGLYRMRSIIEKPAVGYAPSNLAVAGRYVLTPGIFACLEKTAPDRRGELQITDAIQMHLAEQPYYAFQIAGKRHDIGSRIDYAKTFVEFAARREDIGPEFRAFLKEFAAGLSASPGSPDGHRLQK